MQANGTPEPQNVATLPLEGTSEQGAEIAREAGTRSQFRERLQAARAQDPAD